MIKVKICGIRTIDAATAAVEAGADFLGFNFVPTSQRCINPFDAAKIIKQIKGQVKIVGVFQNADLSYVKNLVSELKLDYAQLHGSEDNKYINNVAIPVIKSITLDDQVERIKADYLLLDRTKRGEGKMVDFAKAAKLAANFRMFIAGGLNPDNVANVIKKVRPFAVDVASGVETNGKQDLNKIRLFIKNAKGAI